MRLAVSPILIRILLEEIGVISAYFYDFPVIFGKNCNFLTSNLAIPPFSPSTSAILLIFKFLTFEKDNFIDFSAFYLFYKFFSRQFSMNSNDSSLSSAGKENDSLCEFSISPSLIQNLLILAAMFGYSPSKMTPQRAEKIQASEARAKVLKERAQEAEWVFGV